MGPQTDEVSPQRCAVVSIPSLMTVNGHETVAQRFEEVAQRLEKVAQRFEEVAQRLEKVAQRLEDVAAKGWTRGSYS
jgi:tetrahydromethanopterin S-methyltransferase subunit G